MDRRAWQATVLGVTKESDTAEHACTRRDIGTKEKTPRLKGIKEVYKTIHSIESK